MSAKVGIVGYQMGNINCVQNAFLALEHDVFIADRPERLREATHMVLPGVGAFPRGMQHLRELGFDEELRRLVGEGRPLLGICLGMQLLASEGTEHEPCAGLGLIHGRVVRFELLGERIPHMGWNDTTSSRDNALLGDAGESGVHYYVHSYHLVPDEPADTILTCAYGEEFVSGVARENVYGVQFHPEKSHQDGLALLRRFTQLPC